MIKKIYASLSIALIFISIWIEAIEAMHPKLIEPYLQLILWAEYFILGVFTTEFSIKCILERQTLKYIFSFDGAVDAISILPSLAALLFGYPHSLVWVRALRLARLTRLLKVNQYGSWLGGISGRVIPYVALAIGLKSIILIVEQEAWWQISKEFNIVIGVVGFSLAVLLGSKLSTVNSRMYSIEDTVCRLVGSMRDMWCNPDIQHDLKMWSLEFEKFIKMPRSEKIKKASDLRDLTDALEQTLELSGIRGPNSAGFHRDAAFLIHRATAKTPAAYDLFLKYVIFSYSVTLIVAIPGLLGILATFLSVYVLGGVYFLVDDMDDPLSYEGNSFIDARLDALEYWNQSKHNLS